MKDSFSTNTKKELLNEDKMKKCCAFSLLYGFSFLADQENEEYILKKTNAENAFLVSKIVSTLLKNKRVYYNEKTKELSLAKGIVIFSTFAEYKEKIFKCESCTGSFLKGVFLACGTVNDPSKSYGLELILKDENRQKTLFDFLVSIGFSPKLSKRKNKYLVYFRSSEQIENFLAKIGAVNATFSVMNSKIYKDVTNNVNRVANCDSANISKTVKATEKYIDAILNLIETGKIEILPEQLQETALKRIEFKELNFEQLGKKFSPPISKSGIYHRLEKILDFYKSQNN